MALAELMKSLSESAAASELRKDQTESFMTQMLQQKANSQYAQEQANANSRRQNANVPNVVGGSSGATGFSGPLKGLTPYSLIDPIKGADYNLDSYGPRIHPITGQSGFHTGVDISGGMGTPIRAVANGVIKQANRGDSIYGNQIVLGMGKGWQTMYGHMSRLNARVGQRVHRGDIIGYVGSTGLSTGPHLHFEVWRRGNPTNPGQYLRRR